MSTYRVTFGQKYRHVPHLLFPAAHPDGWVEIEAEDEDAARQVAFRFLGNQWSGLYWQKDAITSDKYPRGCLGRFTDMKTEGLGSPLAIEILLQCYYSPNPFREPESLPRSKAIAFLVETKAIEPSTASGSGYVTTPLGQAWVRALERVPAPSARLVYVDENGRVL